MKNRNLTNRNSAIGAALLCAAIGWLCWSAAIYCPAQTPPANPSGLSPDLQEVVKLSQQQMSDDVIINYIKNTGKSYTLTADDMIYLKQQGVSQAVISALLQTAAPSGANPASPSVPAPPANANPPPGAGASSPVPPPLDDNSGSSASTAPAPAPVSPSVPVPPPPTAVAPGLQDNFFADPGLTPGLWQTQSGLLASLASMNGAQVLPALSFSPSGMQMSGIGGLRQFMGIQSTASFVPPFTFSATVTGRAQRGIPFEIYLASGDLQQWISIAGHLGGRATGGAAVGLGPLHIRVPPSASPEYGVWINHTGSGWPISALGNRLFGDPIADVPYTVQISVGTDGAASVTLLDPSGIVLAAQSGVPVGTGPFYVVLAGRDALTFANWQSVQLTPSTPVVVEQPVAPATPTLDYFQAQLAPYGNWVNVPGYGLCWEPAVDANWRPYYDGGHWEYTDAGWYWQSDYPWGDITFHYGRWAYVELASDPCWVWVPAYDYAPAWVVWRHADDDGYLGWAPLPPGAVFVDGGWVFRGAHVGVDFDFGLGAGFFTFVAYDHFWDHDFRHWIVPHDRLALIYRHSLIENRFRRDEHGRFINEGLARDRMAALTHHDVRPMAVQDLRRQEEQRNALVRRDDLRDFKPGAKPNALRNAEVRPGFGNQPPGRPGGENPNPGGFGNGGKPGGNPALHPGGSKGQPGGGGNAAGGGKGGNGNPKNDGN